MRIFLMGFCLLCAAASLTAETSQRCSIGPARWGGQDGRMEFSQSRGTCAAGNDCNESNSDMNWGRWTGVTPGDLQHEGAEVDARMAAEAGEIRCIGKVHDGALQGSYSFTPNLDFARHMEAMGFGSLDTERLQGYAMLDITIGWTRELQEAHVTGMTPDKLMGLRALKVDAAYVRAMAADGYPELAADKLTGMKAVGVTPEKVKAVRAMGYSPSEEELIQMSVFKIDAPFVERIKARGFKNPTIAQLVQIKIFKLDD